MPRSFKASGNASSYRPGRSPAQAEQVAPGREFDRVTNAVIAFPGPHSYSKKRSYSDESVRSRAPGGRRRGSARRTPDQRGERVLGRPHRGERYAHALDTAHRTTGTPRLTGMQSLPRHPDAAACVTADALAMPQRPATASAIAAGRRTGARNRRGGRTCHDTALQARVSCAMPRAGPRIYYMGIERPPLPWSLSQRLGPLRKTVRY